LKTYQRKILQIRISSTEIRIQTQTQLDSGRKKAPKIVSNRSTPQPQRLTYGMTNKQTQTTAMKRRRKRDPTICRRGLDKMDPYLLVKNEIEMLKSPNQALSNIQQIPFSKGVEKWCCYEYFYSCIDK